MNWAKILDDIAEIKYLEIGLGCDLVKELTEQNSIVQMLNKITMVISLASQPFSYLMYTIEQQTYILISWYFLQKYSVGVAMCCIWCQQ